MIGPDGPLPHPVVPRLATVQQLTGDSETFLSQIWRSTCHHHQAAFAEDEALLDVDDFDSLVTEYGLRSPMALIMAGGPPEEPAQLGFTVDGTPMAEGLVVPEAVSAALASGKTVSIRGVNHFWPPIGRYGRRLELELTAGVQANAYLTPAGKSGLALHHDSHDVFVIQTHGEKVWEVYQPRVPNPARPWDPSTDEPGELIGEFTLRPGDCLYIPLGFPHRARTRSEPSLHVTLGVKMPRWLDVFQVLARQAAAVPAFREPLTPRFAKDPVAFRDRLMSRLQMLVLWSSDERLVDGLIDSLWFGQRPPMDGRIADAVAADELRDESLVSWRHDHVHELRSSDDEVVLRLWNEELVFPGRFAGALRALSSQDVVKVADIDPGLDGRDRVRLVQRLITSGVVRVRGDRPPASRD